MDIIKMVNIVDIVLQAAVIVHTINAQHAKMTISWLMVIVHKYALLCSILLRLVNVFIVCKTVRYVMMLRYVWFVNMDIKNNKGYVLSNNHVLMDSLLILSPYNVRLVQQIVRIVIYLFVWSVIVVITWTMENV